MLFQVVCVVEYAAALGALDSRRQLVLDLVIDQLDGIFEHFWTLPTHDCFFHVHLVGLFDVFDQLQIGRILALAETTRTRSQILRYHAFALMLVQSSLLDERQSAVTDAWFLPGVEMSESIKREINHPNASTLGFPKIPHLFKPVIS